MLGKRSSWYASVFKDKVASFPDVQKSTFRRFQSAQRPGGFPTIVF